MDQNEIKNKFKNVYLPINRCLWRFCGLLLSFLWLCVGSSNFFARPLKRIVLVFSLPSQKKSLPRLDLSAILSIYDNPPLWNILFPFGICTWIYGKCIHVAHIGDSLKDAARVSD